MKDIALKLNVKEWQDWYRVKASDIRNNNSHNLLGRYENYEDLIMKIFPEHPWNPIVKMLISFLIYFSTSKYSLRKQKNIKSH